MIEVARPPRPDAPDAGVCILGAGAAGLSAAWWLKARGVRRILVLEREAAVGGKCRSATADGHVLEMGAIAVFPCYRHVRSFIARFGLETEPLGSYDLMHRETGEVAPLTQIRNGVGALRFLADVTRFHVERARVAPRVDAPLAFRGLSPELCGPFDAWLRARRLGALERLFHIPVTHFGYGYLDEIPTAYALRYLRSAMLNDFVAYGLRRAKAIHWLPRAGYQGLLRAMADDLVRDAPHIRVVTEATEARIERGERITVWTGAGPAESYGTLILTSADARDLEPTVRLQPREREVFSRVRFRNYATILARVAGVAPGGHGCVGSDTLLQLFRPRADRDLAVLYAYARDASVSLDCLVEGCERALRAMGGRVVRVLEARAWRFFPHFDEEALRDGWADRLRDLCHNDWHTHYAGSLLGFENVEEVMAVSRHVAETMTVEGVAPGPAMAR